MLLTPTAHDSQLLTPTKNVSAMPEFKEKTIILPDLEQICPWNWGVNPHYDVVGEYYITCWLRIYLI